MDPPATIVNGSPPPDPAFRVACPGPVAPATSGAHADERFRALLEAAPDAMVIIDHRGIIQLVNTQAERVFGYTRGELLGKPVELLVPARFHQIHERHRVAFAAAPFTRSLGSGRVLAAVRRDGSEFPAEIGISPLQTPEGMLVISSVRDVTERSRAEEEIRRLNGELEEGVSRRTAALRKANDELRREITARHRLEREILEISEREQQRIGQDLHDDLGQRLVGIAYLSEVLANGLTAAGSPEAEHAAKISSLLKNALALTRSLARGLHPVALKSGGLMAAMADMAERTSEIFQIECTFSGRIDDSLLPDTVATHLYRIAQEAVTNAVNHGKATHIDISLEHLEPAGGHRLCVHDNGSGMPRLNPRRSGMGLRIMRYRADVIRAQLLIKNHPDGGTLISCDIPPAE